jgi:hypothetical protein
MALFTLGGGYDAIIKSWWQEKRGENAQGQGPQPRDDRATNCAKRHSTKTFAGL